MSNDNILITQLEDLKHKFKTYNINNNINGEQEIFIELKKENLNCPYCSSIENTVHGYTKRKIIHTYSHRLKTNIILNQTRYRCKKCLKTFLSSDPFTSTHKGISILTVVNILEYLKEVNHTFVGAANEFNVSAKSVTEIFDYHVKPSKLRLPEIMCIDEVYTKTSVKNLYSTVLLNFDNSDIIDILGSRKKYYLDEYFSRFSISELDEVKIVIMDMWSTYRDIIKRRLPKAKIAVDPFHVIKNFMVILNRYRLKIANQFLAISNTNIETNYSNDYGYFLKDYSYILMNNYDDISKKHLYIRKYKLYKYKNELLEHLLKADSNLKKLYEIKEQIILFYRDSNSSTSRTNLNNLINITSTSNIETVKTYSRMLKNWQEEIINSFTKDKGIKYHNGKIERKNRDIKTLIRLSSGYKNQSRLRARIMYSINKNVNYTL